MAKFEFFFLMFRKLKKLVSSRKSMIQPKAVYGGEFWAPEISSRQGIWSIR